MNGKAEARQLSLEEAMNLAPAELLPRQTRSGNSLLYTEQSGQLNVAYVLGKENGNGYVVLSADDIMPPVLGYADSGSFDPDNIPPAMSAWLKEYSRQLSYAVEKGISGKFDSRSDSELDIIPPLCASKWDQMAPYNNLCPKVGGSTAPTGCTATAIAQAMYHHKWPAKGTGVHSYTPAGFNQSLSFDFGNTEFHWEDMLDNYSGNYNTDQANAVATLMLACGNASLMQYGQNESGAYPYDAVYGMVKYLGYDRSAIMAERDYYPSEEWNTLVYNELKNGRPVVYGGYNDVAGHTFIVDGYNGDGFFHLNWGWSGMSDGFFRLTALDPDAQGTGGSSAGYNFYQSAILNLMPERKDSDYEFVIYGHGNFGTEKNSYNVNERIMFNAGENGYFKAFTLIDREITFGIILTPADGGEGVFYPGSKAEYKSYYGNPYIQSYQGFSVDASSLPKNGEYIAMPAYSLDGAISLVRNKVGCVSSLNVSCTGDAVLFSGIIPERVLSTDDIILETPIYSGKNTRLKATVNNSGSEYLGQIAPVLTSENHTVVAMMNGVIANLNDGESVELSFSGTFLSGNKAVEPGDYFLNLMDENGNLLCTGNIEATVLEVPQGQPVCVARLTAPQEKTGKGTSSNPFMIGDFMECNFKIEVMSGLYDEDVSIYAYYDPSYEYADFGEGSVTSKNCLIPAGSSENITFKLNTSEFKLGEKVFLQVYGWGSNDMQPTEWFGNKLYVIRSTNGIEYGTIDDKGYLSPNPAYDTTTVTTEAEIKEISVYSLSGAKISSIEFNSNSNRETIDVSNLKSGHYVVYVATSKGYECYRLIKK